MRALSVDPAHHRGRSRRSDTGATASFRRRTAQCRRGSEQREDCVMESAARIATREGGTTTMSAAQLRELGQQISGRIVERGDASWNDAIQVWNGLVAKTPALVIQPASALDVAAV